MTSWRIRIGLAICYIAVCVASTFADNRVLVIGIDGAGGSFSRDASTPHIDALIANGTVRYDYLNEGALVPIPPSGYGASGVNWSTILTGASAAHHGVTDNSFAGNNFQTFPHFFKYVKDHNAAMYTASIVSWAPINEQILPNQYANLERQFPGLSSSAQDTEVRRATVDILSHGDPHAIFLHFDQVDAAGHGFGWGSPQFFSAIQAVDSHVGQIMAALNARPNVQAGTEDWLVMVTADHGGQGTSHHAGQGLINWEVPFVLSGSSVVEGTDIPRGTLRDVAPTALWHLGIDPFALGLDGTVRGISIGPPNGIVGDVNQDGNVSGTGAGPAASDDVSAFLAGWLVAGTGGIAERYQRGDLNYDGITNLADWAILHNAQPALALAAFRRLQAVPEPSNWFLSAVVLVHAAASIRQRAVDIGRTGHETIPGMQP